VNEGRDGVLTTTDEVRSSYYGFPVIKAAHWGWLVVLYFFFGGIAGGGLTIGALATLRGERRLARLAHYIGMAALLPSPILLILDLGRPERFLHMLRILKVRSPLSLGSWALTLLGLFGGGAAGLQLLSDLTGKPVLPAAQKAFAVLTLPFSLFLTGYTGVLLAVTNIPLWARNYLLLGPTFVASAFSTTLAAISLFSEKHEDAERLARAEVMCAVAELSFLTAGLVRLGRLGRPLTSGSWAAVFWPVTVLAGLLAPLGLNLAAAGSGSVTMRRASAVLTLLGGFSLRTVMIFAGRESARRPEDYFEYTRKR